MPHRVPSDPTLPPPPPPSSSSSSPPVASATSTEPSQPLARSTSVGGATRRPKPHVIAACSNCKKAHLACDVGRPCQRCINLGKQDTCVDVRHKKRGRPRLRNDLPVVRNRSSSASTSASTSPVTTFSVATAAPPPPPGPEYRIPPQLYSRPTPPTPLSTRPPGDLYVVMRANRDLQVLQMSQALRRRTPVPATLGDVLAPDPAREERISRALHSLTQSADESAAATEILTTTPLADLVAPVVPGAAAAAGLSPATARQISADRACVVFYVRDTIRGMTVEYVVVRIIDSAAPAPLRRGFGLDDILG
ncbi:hypothetical protein V1517DRAFT_332577 [Lipomyces orientalis]|uniref:Uncharacterized protein n=1 Tax=Lipomyces orientalis TaxID=1233043 RepID=A0ACC3TEY9_9ASCO